MMDIDELSVQYHHLVESTHIFVVFASGKGHFLCGDFKLSLELAYIWQANCTLRVSIPSKNILFGLNL